MPCPKFAEALLHSIGDGTSSITDNILGGDSFVLNEVEDVENSWGVLMARDSDQTEEELPSGCHNT